MVVEMMDEVWRLVLTVLWGVRVLFPSRVGEIFFSVFSVDFFHGFFPCFFLVLVFIFVVFDSWFVDFFQDFSRFLSFFWTFWTFLSFFVFFFDFFSTFFPQYLIYRNLDYLIYRCHLIYRNLDYLIYRNFREISEKRWSEEVFGSSEITSEKPKWVNSYPSPEKELKVPFRSINAVRSRQ